MMYFIAVIIGIAIIGAYRQGLRDGKSVILNEPLQENNITPAVKTITKMFNGNYKQEKEAQQREIQREQALKQQEDAVDAFCDNGGIVI